MTKNKHSLPSGVQESFNRMNFNLHFVIFTICLCLTCVFGNDAPESSTTYTTKYDAIDLNDLLKNDRLRRNYVNCLMNEGPCTPDGQELKSNAKTPTRILILSSLPKLKDFFVRLHSRRGSYGLFQVLGETERRLDDSDTLSD